MKNLPIAGIRIQQAFLSVWKSNKFCVVRESNPGQLLGRQLWYHFTNNALSILSRQWRPLLSLPLRQQALSLFGYLTVRWRRLSVECSERRPWAQTSFSSYRFPVWCAQTPLSEKYIDSDALADVMRMLTDLPDLFSTSLSCSLLLWTTTFTKPKQTDFLQLSVDKLSEGTCHRH